VMVQGEPICVVEDAQDDRLTADDTRVGDVSSLLLHRLAPSIARLPGLLRLETAALFTDRPLPRSARAFNRRAGVDVRTVQRWYLRVGLAAQSDLLTVARLGRAWRLVRLRRLSHARVATLVEFGCARTFVRACRRFSNCAPADLRWRSAEEFASILTRNIGGAAQLPTPSLHRDAHDER
jgi:AraC-like DNA-binding protein